MPKAAKKPGKALANRGGSMSDGGLGWGHTVGAVLSIGFAAGVWNAWWGYAQPDPALGVPTAAMGYAIGQASIIAGISGLISLVLALRWSPNRWAAFRRRWVIGSACLAIGLSLIGLMRAVGLM